MRTRYAEVILGNRRFPMAATSLKFMILIVCLFSITACSQTILPFSNRLASGPLEGAKQLATNGREPVSLEWWPAEFPSRADLLGPSGFIGWQSKTRVPTGVGLANRITEALDASVGVDPASKRVLELYIVKAESEFTYWDYLYNVQPSIDYGKCTAEIEFDYNGTRWKKSFVAEVKDTNSVPASQTGPLEKAWDSLSLQVAQEVVRTISGLPKNDTYKESEAYRARKVQAAQEREKTRKLEEIDRNLSLNPRF